MLYHCLREWTCTWYTWRVSPSRSATEVPSDSHVREGKLGDFKIFILFWGGGHVLQGMFGCQRRTCRNWFSLSPSTMWVPGIELRSPSLDGCVFTTEPPLWPLVTFRISLSLFKGPEILRYSQHAQLLDKYSVDQQRLIELWMQKVRVSICTYKSRTSGVLSWVSWGQ